MQRLCTACGETELRDMTDEEQFKQLLNGHWQPYEVTMMGATRLVYYLRTGIWYVYADYDGGDSLTYVSSLSERGIDQFTKKLEIHYSHLDAQTGIHHATATSADGHSAQIQLETGHGEPLLYLTPDPETDLFDRVVFSRYEQIAPIVVGTWSGIKDGTINSITFTLPRRAKNLKLNKKSRSISPGFLKYMMFSVNFTVQRSRSWSPRCKESQRRPYRP
jgi:hypothetical protein